METLMQMRTDLLKNVEKNRKLGICSQVIRQGDDPTISRLISLKKRNKINVKHTKLVESSKESKKIVCSKNENLLSLFKQLKKRSDLSKKLNRSSRFSNNVNIKSESLKKQCEGLQGDQSLSSRPKEKDGGGSQTESLKRKRKTKRRNDKVVRDEASQLQRRARYLLVKLKLEQSLIDAYTGEGWNGQSREKIKPENELQRAKKQLINCKLGIRDTVRQLDLLGSIGKIDESFISPDGSVHHEHIFCKKCQTQEVSEDNDIILCDGTCNCAFHQKCIDPPMATEDIPPEDEGWLCKYCDCKMDLLEAMNAHLGTQFSDACMWQDIFKEEALLSGAGLNDVNREQEWPDDDSDDNDYNPETGEIYSSSRCNAMDDSGSREESSTSSSSCSLESEVYWESGLSTESNEISSDKRHLHHNCVADCNDNDVISGPRKRSAVDYKKLYDEMFAKDVRNSDVVSEDEDWDPRKRRRRKKECAAASTLMTLCGSKVKPSDVQTLGESTRKPLSRIPEDILQKLREAFAENELPSRDVKKEISDLVGLEYKKVNKWFKNARYIALKNRKKERSPQYAAPNNSDTDIDKTVEPIVSKSSEPISSRTKQLKKVKWGDKLTTLICSAKKKHLKRTFLSNDKANVEPSDDMSLKDHLLYLKAKRRREKSGKLYSEHPPVVSPEIQMEQLCQTEGKVRKLKQVVSTFQKAMSDNLKDQPMEENHVVISRLQRSMRNKIVDLQD
ncbi:hypothetical protein RND81_14G093900 [Saponaria officinalis]|uniref:Pathogenesis-related homeodomain protein n=1 Tax=Saponaria officinalis TaxID=3572 RepID=A0AAW1GND0_SAPOF